MKWVQSATAIGIVCGKADKELEVLSDVTREDIEKAKEMIDNGKIFVSLKEGEENLDIDITLYDCKSNNVEVEIKNTHTNIVNIIKNGEVHKYDNCYSTDKSHKDYDKLSVKNIFEYVENVNLEKVENLLE